MKIFRDPIHNVINLDTGDKVINDLIIALIDSKEFQRLRFIKQLGFVYLAYPSATHTRFEHSLGVAFLAKKFLAKISNKNLDKNITIIAALLHDIGHGPLSHTCEKITNMSHEIWTKEIILGNTEVNALLSGYDKQYPKMICDILSSSEIISGKLDVDRMDYLLRDSYMTGSGYGRFDLEWMINVLELHVNGGNIEVVVPNKGQSVADDFEMAREYMYKNVYRHKTNLAAQGMLLQLFERLRLVHKTLTGCKTQPVSDAIKNIFLSDCRETAKLLDDYLSLTDIDLYYLIKQLQYVDDDEIKKLASGILNRSLTTNPPKP